MHGADQEQDHANLYFFYCHKAEHHEIVSPDETINVESHCTVLRPLMGNVQ